MDKTDGCWEWTACVIPSTGIGQFDIQNGKSTVPANKFAYVISGLEIPAGFRLDPNCGNMRCVNPQHQTFAANNSPRSSVIEKIDYENESLPKIAKVWICKKWVR